MSDSKVWLQQCNFEHLGVMVTGEGVPICAYCGTKYELAQQKQPSKDWEIVSFNDKLDGVVYELDGNGKYTYNNIRSYTLQSMLSHGRCINSGDIEIHEVRRICDNLVFKVDGDSDKGLITKFEIVGNEMCVYTVNPHRQWYYLSQIKEVKPKLPLFTTEDGVGIFKGDIFFAVTDNWDVVFSNATEVVKYKGRTFAKTENAEKFILENKPISVSYKELTEQFDFKCKSSAKYLTVREFFKSKINP